jgi:hypothetical protein
MENNNQVIKMEEDKISSLTIINDEKRREIMAAAPYTTIPYMPIKVDFIENYILNDNEYPLVESKLSQSAVEMKARINRLVDAQFNVDKLKLEIRELELDIEDIETSNISEERKEVQINKKNLEIRQKKWLMGNHINDCETNYSEFIEWKTVIEDCIHTIQKHDPTITDFTKIPYEKIRMAEMEIKIRKWKEMEKRGVELTQSQRSLIRE